MIFFLFYYFNFTSKFEAIQHNIIQWKYNKNQGSIKKKATENKQQ